MGKNDLYHKVLTFLFLFFGTLLIGQNGPLEYTVETTQIKKLGHTKTIRELDPKANTSQAKKAIYKLNKQAPDNFVGRGKSKVIKPELEHQGPDPIRQKQMGSKKAGEPIVNVDGLFNSFGSPHDPTGDVGSRHYVQAINATIIGVFSKEGELESTFNANTLWSQFGMSGAGDPIILFDELSQRWMITEFAFPADVLIAISDTDDPLGGYTAFNFNTPNFPDYPHYAIWPNAIVFTSNEGGAGRLHNYLIDRKALMSDEDNVTMQRIEIVGSNNTEAGFYVSTPLDFSGTELPPDSLPMVMKINDSSWGDVDEDQIELFRFDIDWENSANTQVIQTELVTTPFDSYPCSASSFGFSCVPQLNGSGLDAIPEVIMNVPQYRNFGTHESIVLSFITDATDGENLSGIRWMELRRTPVEDWFIYQEGTYAPDLKDRYMCSIAIDKNGNIGLGYNVSSAEDYVGIRYTGRFAGDPLGEMTLEEVTVVDGVNNINSGARFGDYAQMGIDPEDGITFWYTSEYAGSGTNNSRTRIVAFQLQKSQFDAKPVVISSPVSSSMLTENELVTITVRNNGLMDIENLTLGLIVGDSTIGTFLVPEVLGENQTYEHTFTETIDMHLIGDYTIGAFTSFELDENIENDTIYTTISQIADIDGSLSIEEDISTCNEEKSVTFKLTNSGFSPILEAVVKISVNADSIGLEMYSGNLGMGMFTEISTQLEGLAEGENAITFEILSINGIVDGYDANNSAEMIVDFTSGSKEFIFQILTDNFPNETTWILTDVETGDLIDLGGGYDQDTTVYTETFCLLDNRCYRFTIFDNNSDGICCGFGLGNYQILDAQGDTLINSNGDFGSNEVSDFCAGIGCILTAEIESSPVTNETDPNGSILITPNGGVEPYSYSIDGGSTFQDSPLFENLTVGEYAVVVLSSGGGCQLEVDVMVDLYVSVIDLEGKYNIKVTPNPGNGFYDVAISNFVTSDYAMKMQVIDVNGKLLQEMSLQKYNEVFRGNISLVAYPSGTYYLRFLDRRIVTMSRLIKL